MGIQKKKDLGIATTAMTKKEAKVCLKNIKSYGKKLQQKLLVFYMGKGFKALGYDSFKEWCEAEVTNISYDILNNNLNAARITLDMAGNDLVGRYSPWALAPLKKHSPQVRREVYALAQDKCGIQKVPAKYLTRKFVETALVELKPEQDKTSTPTEQSEDTYIKTELEEKFRSEWRVQDKKKHFLERVAITLAVSAKPKQIAKMCRYLLKEKLQGEDVELAIKSIEKYLEQDK